MLLEKFDLKRYMAHKPPMLLVDKVLEESGKRAKTSFAVKEDNIFLDENGIFARAAIVEVAAQSFAAADIYQRIKSKKPLVKGFLVSVRNFSFAADVRAGDELICDIRETNDIAQLHVVEAELYAAGARVACGELRIFELPGNPE